MSILIVDDKIFDIVLYNLGRYQDCPYFMPMGADCETTFKRLHAAMHKSYAERYKNASSVPKYKPYAAYSAIKEIPPLISVCQLLKYMQCINYQIETNKPTFYEKDAIKRLNDLITQLKNGILRSMPNYENALWTEIVQNKSNEVI